MLDLIFWTKIIVVVISQFYVLCCEKLTLIKGIILFVVAPDKPVDLDLDACEQNQDVDFVFTGFEVTGKVSCITSYSHCVFRL